MNNTPTSADPVFSLHHTHSNAHGRVATYYAHPIVASKINLPVNILDRASAVQSHVYAAAWLVGLKNGAAK